MNLIDWMRKIRMLHIGSYSGVYRNRVAPGDVLDNFDNKMDKEFLDSYRNEGGNPAKKDTKMWKKILGTIVGLIVLLVVLVMYATSGMTDVAKEFFIHVKSKHFDDAYNMLSEDFRHTVSKEEFKKFLEQNALVNYEDASWSSRSFEGNMGKLEGSITTKSGSTIPLTITFVKDAQEQWQIYSLSKPSSGIQTTDASADKPQALSQPAAAKSDTPQVPDTKTVQQLIGEITQVFAKSVNAKSMAQMYDYISDFWKENSDISVAKLDEVFDGFYKAGVDLTILKNFTPILDEEPKILNGMILDVKGHYPTSPGVVHFEYQYIKEKGAWKLAAINININ